MSTNYDAKNNILYIPTKEDKKTKARGFVVTVVDTQEEAIAMQKGEHTKFNLSPVLASSEQLALEFIETTGKIALSIVPLELLEMQINLLYDLSKEKNIELIRENLFKVEKN